MTKVSMVRRIQTVTTDRDKGQHGKEDTDRDKGQQGWGGHRP